MEPTDRHHYFGTMSAPTTDDVSIAATDATVAGSSVAATEVIEDAEDDFDDGDVQAAASPAIGPDDDDDDAPPPPPSTLRIDPSSVDAASSMSSSTALHRPRMSQSRGLHTGHNHDVDVIDPDILLDRMGFLDLNVEVTQGTVQEMLKMSHSTNPNHLSTLNERMSEEAIDDAGAFRDLTFVAKGAEGGGHVGSFPDHDPNDPPSRKMSTLDEAEED